jgi:uncharacterized protein YwqG
MNEVEIKRMLATIGLAEYTEKILSLAKPCARMVSARAEGAGISKIGGAPLLPVDFIWPTWNGKSQAFIVQIDCAVLHTIVQIPDMPETGVLSFFYDVEAMTWGFDPKDKGSFSVSYFPDTAQLQTLAYPDDIPEHARFTEQHIAFESSLSIPGMLMHYMHTEVGLSESQLQEYISARQEIVPSPRHQVGGYATEIQDVMELSCELVTHGLYTGNPDFLQDPRYDSIKASNWKKEWQLLLQIDSDEKSNMMWGDAGALYFWIKESDLRARQFENMWIQSQCS